jgi:alanine racemase
MHVVESTDPSVDVPADSTEPGLPPQTWAEIDLPALRRNFRRVADRVPPSVKLILSVKKDGYGHGLLRVVQALEHEPRLSAIGVATVEEGLALRGRGVAMPILCFSVLRGRELRAAVRHGIALTVTDAGEGGEADRAAAEAGLVATMHYKIDTGMGRLGRVPGETLRSLPDVLRLSHARLAAVYTHLPDGWRRPEDARRQMDALADFAREAGLSDPTLHLGGSDALSVRDHAALGLLRAGIAVFGYHEGVEGLEPVMHFKTRVIYRRRASAGSPISYGGTHILARDSELAIVGAGYGNGYPVALSNRASVLIRGRRFPVLGRVCMDQTVVDVTGAPEIACGDEVVLFGRQGEATLGADEVAQWAGTIPYELLCLAGRMNPRVYLPEASSSSSAANPSRNDG